MRHRLICAALLSLAVAVGGISARAGPVELTPGEMHVAANRALQSGNPGAALLLADALLERDPQDLTALLLKARAARDQSRFRTAIKTARQAWSISRAPEERYASALIMAQALSSSGAKTRAQLWLRRAAQNAPDEALKRLAVRDFRYVRDTNPFSTQLRFSITPNSNINNGSKSDTLVIGGLAFDLSGDAQALSGIEYRFGVTTTYRQRRSERQVVKLGFSLDSRTYSLSKAAERQAPSARASDFRFLSAELHLDSSILAKTGRTITDLGLVAGRNWYAGNPLTGYLRASFGQRFKQSDQSQWNYQISGERQLRQDNASRSATVLTAQAGWRYTFGGGTQLVWNLGLRDTRSRASSIGHDAIFTGLRYAPRIRIAGASMAWSMGLETRFYDKPNFGIQRKDRRASLGLTLFFRNVDYYGFAPTVSLSWSRDASNVSLYDSETVGLSIGLRSAF